MGNDTIEIPRNRYEALLRAEAWVSCLEAARVDCWEGIEVAVELFQQEYPDE